ncbi:MAG: DUF2100 domain-containing protein [archaeon]|nr:DUF2100 domain-containing protein [archaeon]
MDKNLNFSPDDNKRILEVINRLISLKSLTRRFAPEFQIPTEKSREILENLENVTKELFPILVNLGIIDKENIDIKNPSNKIKLQKYLPSNKTNIVGEDYFIEKGSELLQIAENKIILVSSNSSKKKLKSLGINPQYIKSSGGPFFIEDYQKLDKKLPDKAIEGIKKKLDNLMNQLKKVATESKEIIYIYSDEEITDIINMERIKKLKKIITEDLKLVRIKSWSKI